MWRIKNVKRKVFLHFIPDFKVQGGSDIPTLERRVEQK